MIARRTAGAFGLSVLMSVLATEALAQFDAQHDHLKCYKITGGAIVTKVQTDNQFGREMIFKLVPQFLCAPTQKTCLATDGSCGKPGAPSGSPVQHFKCYKVAAKECPNNDCSKVTGRFAPVPATLLDQFGTEQVTVGTPKLLCAPVEKTVAVTSTTSPPSSTTTTTTQCSCPTTTTVPPCSIATFPSCGGTCPAGQSCYPANVGTSSGGTVCVCGTTNAPCPGTLNAQATCNAAFACPPGRWCLAAQEAQCFGCCSPTGAPCTVGVFTCCNGACSSGVCP